MVPISPKVNTLNQMNHGILFASTQPVKSHMKIIFMTVAGPYNMQISPLRRSRRGMNPII